MLLFLQFFLILFQGSLIHAWEPSTTTRPVGRVARSDGINRNCRLNTLLHGLTHEPWVIITIPCRIEKKTAQHRRLQILRYAFPTLVLPRSGIRWSGSTNPLSAGPPAPICMYLFVT